MMCLSNVFSVTPDGSQTLVSEGVTGILIAGDSVKLTDIMGREICVSGMLKSVDLIKNAVLIETA
jgi:predicted RNA-binding protein